MDSTATQPHSTWGVSLPCLAFQRFPLLHQADDPRYFWQPTILQGLHHSPPPGDAANLGTWINSKKLSLPLEFVNLFFLGGLRWCFFKRMRLHICGPGLKIASICIIKNTRFEACYMWGHSNIGQPLEMIYKHHQHSPTNLQDQSGWKNAVQQRGWWRFSQRLGNQAGEYPLNPNLEMLHTTPFLSNASLRTVDI